MLDLSFYLLLIFWSSDRWLVHLIQSALKTHTTLTELHPTIVFYFSSSLIFWNDETRFMLDALIPLFKCRIHPAAALMCDWQNLITGLKVSPTLDSPISLSVGVVPSLSDERDVLEVRATGHWNEMLSLSCLWKAKKAKKKVIQHTFQ